MGTFDDSLKIFWTLKERDHVVWTALLAGFRNNGDLEQGLDLYLKYVAEGYRLDMYMFANVFNLCSDLGTARLGFQVHACLAKSGFVLDSFVGSALVDMYGGLGMADEAYRGFLDTADKNEVAYSVMIHGFVCDSDYGSAIELYREMRMMGFVPDSFTLSSMLRATTGLGMLEEGRALHSLLVKTFGESNLTIGNNLIEMYAESKTIDEAAKVFTAMEVRNEYSWTSLVFGYIESEKYAEAMELYMRMISSGSVEPSEFTIVGILQATSKLQEGQQTHNYIIKKGFQSHIYIESALIGMYSKCGCINDASRIFSTMSERDLVSWSNMIASYAQNGHGQEALKLFSEYNDRLNSIDESVLSSCLSVCSSLTALETGKAIHAGTIKSGYESNLQVGSTIVDMYCKCGSIKEARSFFDGIKEHSVVSYTAMLCGYAQHGLGHEALGVFDRMKEAGIEPDGVTLVGVLSACSHIGLVKEGWDYFKSMTEEYGLEKSLSHYACVVDLLGRSGQVSEAEKLIADAPFGSKALLWRTLLGACSLHGNVEDGNRIAETLMRLEPDEPSNYVMLSNLLASVSMWDHCTELKQKMQRGHLQKTPGVSWIELSN
ncbi:pentatricopeptide repeat-containing protein-like [Iris pallida]|uniref:Pentatricopeptide repeat-containing protein-like n=1 Tax=Iris pallida TaxID=29817 RepID=A0AAX6DPJ4_IRIPA|nr:pentatricopeptide repeat-containing protein-like [Iris pallida]